MNMNYEKIINIIELITIKTNQKFETILTEDSLAPMIYMEGLCYYFHLILKELFNLDEDSLMITLTGDHVGTLIDGIVYDAIGNEEIEFFRKPNVNDLKCIKEYFIKDDVFNNELVKMIVNDVRKECNMILPIKDINKYYVVADFDRTLTMGDSKTSWSILADTPLLPLSYTKERNDLYNKYRPIEIDESIDFETRFKLVREWYQKHIELFIKYQLKEDVFNIANEYNSMQFRTGVLDFLKILNDNNIPLIIISAGIGNFIEAFLNKNNCYYNNISVISNKIIFKDGIAVGVENIIHSLNKNETAIPTSIKEKIKDRNNVILLGDQIGDLQMADETKYDSIIKIGFYNEIINMEYKEFKKYFDIVYIDKKDDYHTLIKTLF